ncbi:MAG: aspartate:alanine exchanger family transporter [Vulcanimicrobiota bacterium]
MQTLHDFLADSVTLRLFAVIGLGYVVGAWRIRGFSLGVAAVLFVGLGLGAWDPQAFDIPPVVSGIGLALFVYTIGLASGPGVFQALQTSQGLRLSLLTAVAVLAAAGATLGLTSLAHLPGAQAAGLFCGATTNTPALAAQLEMQQRLAKVSSDSVDLEGPAVGYSVAYPFGVLGVFAVMALLLRSTNPEQEVASYDQESGGGRGPVTARNYRVTRLKPNTNQLEVGWVAEHCGLIVARRLHEGRLDTVEPETVLAVGDIVLAVGNEEMHAQALEILGEPTDEHLEQQHGQVTYGRFFVSNQDLVGKRLEELHLEAAYRVTATRIRRGDVEVPASSHWLLEEGDVVRVVGRAPDLERAGKFLGDSLEQIAHTDYLSVSLGMVLGVLIGSIPIPVGSQPYPTLGVAGGCLVVALILGKLRRTGNIVWTLSLEANLALRQIGLLFFLASVGIKAGGQFVGAMQTNGLLLMGCGAIITLTSALILGLGGRHLGVNLVTLLGVISGAHTQPACLAYANSLVKSDGVNIGYSSVFSVAMITKIVVATTLLSLLR